MLSCPRRGNLGWTGLWCCHTLFFSGKRVRSGRVFRCCRIIPQGYDVSLISLDCKSVFRKLTPGYIIWMSGGVGRSFPLNNANLVVSCNRIPFVFDAKILDRLEVIIIWGWCSHFWMISSLWSLKYLLWFCWVQVNNIICCLVSMLEVSSWFNIFLLDSCARNFYRLIAFSNSIISSSGTDIY